MASIEGDPPEGTAGGGEAPPLTGPPADDPPPANAAERTFTQAEMDNIIGDRLRRDRAARAPVPPPAAAAIPAAPPSTKTPTAQELAADLAALKTQLAFADTLSTIPGAASLTLQQRNAAKQLFDPANPAGLIDTIALFGPVAPAAAEPETAALAADPPVPFSAGAAPSAPPRAESLNPLTWTKADIEALQSRGEFRQKIDEWRAALPGGAPLFARRVPKS